MLQRMIERLVDIVTCYGMEKNEEYFNLLGYLVQYLHAKFNLGFLWQKQD